MDKPPHGEKENTPSVHTFQNNFPLIQQNTTQFIPSNLQKKPKTNKIKAQKGFSSNLRAGDWVCLICNNLNFSFRNECNRCQIQTKEQNQIQTMYLTENSNLQSNDPQIRLPFQDLTNQKYYQAKLGQPGFHSKSKSTPMQSEFDLNLVSRLPETQHNIEGNMEAKKTSSLNKGFQNMLLVTPPKHRQNKSVNIFKEYSDSSQKELPPYRSPEHLPSVSPILKKVFGYDFKDVEYQDDKINNSLKFLKEENEESESPEEERIQSRDNELQRQTDLVQRNLKEDLGLFAHVNSQNLRLKQPLHPIDELSYFQSGKSENKGDKKPQN